MVQGNNHHQSHSSRQRSASARTPMDADGHFGGCPPRSVMEPELTVEGKIVLVGNPVPVIRVHSNQNPNNEGTKTATASPSRIRSSRREQNEERDREPQKRSGPQQVEPKNEDLESREDNRNDSDACGATSSYSSLLWPLQLIRQSSSLNPSSAQHSDAVTAAQESSKSFFWGWFGGAETREDPEASAAVASFAPDNSKKALFSWTAAIQKDDDDADENDEDSAGDGNSTSRLFGDLRSLPSVNGDVTIGGESLKSTDFENRDDHSVGRVESVEKKLQEIIIPTEYKQQLHQQQPPINSLPASPTPTKSHFLANMSPCTPSVTAALSPNQNNAKNSLSIQNRRQILVKELRSAIASFGRYDVRCANVSSALGDLLDEGGEYDQAIKLHKDSVTIYSVKLGDQHPTTCDAKQRLAAVLSNAGQYDEAIATYYSVMAMNRAMKGDKDPIVADLLALMSNTLRKNGEYQQAIKELKRALKIYRESLGDSHEKVASTVDAIASLYVTVGDFEKSSAILEEVVKLKAATVGMKSKAVAETLTCLAMTYECSEHFAMAMKSLKKAYKIYTEIGGYSSEEATATLSKIALLYEATGDYNRASIAFLGVLRGRKIHHGEDHLLVGETYCKLGHALRETGQLEKALKCMKEALPIYVGKGVEMNDVEKIADIMHEMALIYKDKKHYSEASRIFKQELSVRRKIGQPEFPHIASILNLLGVTEYEMKNNSRALKYLVEALTIFQDQNEHGVACAEVLYNTGLVFAAVRNKDRALEAFTEAERLFSESAAKSAVSHQYLMNTRREISRIRETSSVISRFK